MEISGDTKQHLIRCYLLLSLNSSNRVRTGLHQQSQLILLMNPYDLFIHIDRFHTDAGNVDAEVCGCGDIITDFKFFILIRVKKEAGIGRRRFCKYFAFCS